MHRFLITVFLFALAGLFVEGPVLAQGQAPPPPPKDPPPAEKPKEPPPKDKEKPKDEKTPKEEPQETAEEQTLKAVKLPIDGPGLLNFFRKRSVDRVAPEEIAKLVKQLGDPKAENRDQAFRDLVSYGLLAVPHLRHASNDLDEPDIAALAKQCLQAMEPSTRSAVATAAVRRLAESKASGAAEVLLSYLPYAEDENIFEEIKSTLTTLGVGGDKADPALVQALSDPMPLRRAIAAEILCQIGGTEVRPALRKLMQDPKPSVRMRVALALAQSHDAEAVEVLIRLFGDLPQDQTRVVEDFLSQLAGEWTISTPKGDDEISRRLRRDAWAAWWKATDGPMLLDEFRKRTLSDSDRDKGLALMPKLDDDSADIREKALTDLLSLGNGAIPLLRQAANNPDAKSRERIQKSLDLLDKGTATPLPSVAARLVGLRKPAGAAEALLNYLPLAEDEAMSDEIRDALVVVALPDGKLDPILVKMLDDKLPLRRAAAAEVICRSGDKENRPAAQKLLKDTDPSVRFQVALAFMSIRDKESVPVLISLLSEGTKDQAERAQGLLFQLADEKTPDVQLGDNDDARKKCRAAWETWWKDNAAKIDLAKLDTHERMLGYTVIIEMWNRFKGQGRVIEVDQKGKVRWTIDNLAAPIDAQVVANGNRVLITEANAQRISERDLKGTIIWQQTINQPLGSQRLANGNTFLSGRNQLMEVDREGKQVGTAISRPSNDIVAAQKLRNGQIAVVTGAGQYIRMDASGKELKQGRVSQLQYYNGDVHILPNDRVIVPLYNQNKVVENNLESKVLWEANVTWPTSAQRLPSGNTLVASVQAMRVVEIDRNGKVVWEYKDNVQPIRAHRR
jgi:HEAT repeat protein